MVVVIRSPRISTLDKPTRTFVRKGYPAPDLSGLYTKFKADEVVERVATIQKLVNNLRRL
jgi:hypothetical protein